MSNKKSELKQWEREEISKGIYAYEKLNKIAKRLGRSPSALTREVRKQVKVKNWCYSATKGQEIATLNRSRRGRLRKINNNQALRDYVETKLREQWSPEEIANRLKIEYAENTTMRVSHETIYQYLYCLPRGELKKELMASLRLRRKRRLSRASIHARRPGIEDAVSISERPNEAAERIIPGHWEGDLIVGKDRQSALGTLAERTTRTVLLVPLKKKDALSVRLAFARAFKRIPKKFAKSLTYDRGTEMAQHKLFTEETGIKVYFADPHSPWQRGTNENTKRFYELITKQKIAINS
ncbi:MAG TPA: IS30 family transposase [bacterium]|nr:IS30 family transposase [bacterium]